MNPTWTCLAERAMGTETQPVSYCSVDSPEKKRCLFTINLSRETDHFRNDCRIYIFRSKYTVHFYTSSLWNICFRLPLNHLCIPRILFSAYKKRDSFSLKDGNYTTTFKWILENLSLYPMLVLIWVVCQVWSNNHITLTKISISGHYHYYFMPSYLRKYMYLFYIFK